VYFVDKISPILGPCLEISSDKLVLLWTTHSSQSGRE